MDDSERRMWIHASASLLDAEVDLLLPYSQDDAALDSMCRMLKQGVAPRSIIQIMQGKRPGSG